MEVLKALAILVGEFAAGDEGLSENVYNSTFYLLRGLMGQKCADDFSMGINATDGEFYWKSPELCMEFLHKWFPQRG
jgi:hypothetical protein